MTDADPRPLLYLEDLSPGLRFETGTIVVTPEEIREFAGAYDPQPFHTDDSAAVGTFFGGLAASGWHTAALTMRLMVDGGPRIAGGLIGGGGEISWPRPTRPGDRLQALMEILEVTPSRTRPERGKVVMRTETQNQNGEVVQTLTSTMLAFRRPSPAET